MTGPVIDEVRITRPCPLSVSAGTAAFTVSIVPLMLVAKIESMSCSVMSLSLASGNTPGVGAQHVETAEAIDRLGHHALGVRRHPDVGTHIRHLSAVGGQLGGGLRSDRGIATDDGDPGTGREEYRGDPPADAFGPAGDKNAPAGYRGEHSAASPSGSRGLIGTPRPART